MHRHQPRYLKLSIQTRLDDASPDYSGVWRRWGLMTVASLFMLALYKILW